MKREFFYYAADKDGNSVCDVVYANNEKEALEKIHKECADNNLDYDCFIETTMWSVYNNVNTDENIPPFNMDDEEIII